jgi:GT2 family glycosyltransferase
MVDNGSTDGSVEFVKSNFPLVKIVENRVNLGFAAGNNVGIRYSSGDYVILLNTDTRVSPNFIEELVNCARMDPEIGSVGCKLLPENKSVKHGPMFTKNGYIVPLLTGGILLKDRLEMLFNTDGYCLSNCAAAALYRKSALEVTEGFDPGFQFDYEDNDLGFRLWVAGYKNYYTTKTNVVHIGGASLGSILSKDRYIRITRNMLFTYIKNYEARNVVTRFLLLLWILIPFHHMAKILFHELRSFGNNSPQQAPGLSRQAYFSLFEAYLQFIRGLRHATRQRAKVQASRKVSDSSIFLLTRRSWII